MTNDKIKELFSAYYENSLDNGLTQTVASRLKEDSNLANEYRSFVVSLESLQLLPKFEVQVPHDLNDLISQKIDRHIWETNRRQPASWLVWARNAAIGAAACLAIVGTYLSYANRSIGEVGAGSWSSGSDHLDFKFIDGNLRVRLAPSSVTTVQFFSEPDNVLFKTVDLNPTQHLDSPLQNKNSSAALFQVSIEGHSNPYLVSIPGSTIKQKEHGTGSLGDFARALSNTYDLPVIVVNPDITKTVDWDFKAGDMLGDASASLAQLNYTVDKRSGDIIYITQQAQ